MRTATRSNPTTLKRFGGIRRKYLKRIAPLPSEHRRGILDIGEEMTRVQKVKLQSKMRRIRNHVALHRDTLPLYLVQPEVEAVQIIERAMRQVNAIKVKP